MTPAGRIMGLDHGTVRIGVALSDPLGLFARPLRVVAATPLQAALQTIKAIVAEEQVSKIVIGLPTDAESGVGHQARQVIAWAQALAREVNVPIVLWDESYSSLSAEALSNSRRRRRGQPLDAVAAAAILQEYLDAGASNHEPGQPLDTFQDSA